MTQRSWIAVASAAHVRIGRAQGFMQVNHGKLPPLKRLQAGDRIAYYSPSVVMKVKDGFQSFTAIGVVAEGSPYVGDMGGGFTPWRRDVAWADAQEVAIRPLLNELEFTRGNSNWGYQLRFGLFEVSNGDMDAIARAMGVGT